MRTPLVIAILVTWAIGGCLAAVQPHNADPTFRGHEKTREERWHLAFRTDADAEQTQIANNLVQLLNRVVNRYMQNCITVVLYDHYVEQVEGFILRAFFQQFQYPYIHGKLSANYTLSNRQLLNATADGGIKCRHYILFLSDVLRTRDVLGAQTHNRVIIVPRSTQWKQQEFLASAASSDIVNLLIVGQSLNVVERASVLYTHRLYTDGLGSNRPTVLTSWMKGSLSRPTVNLFPPKFGAGFAMHRFVVSAVHQPPFVIKRVVTDGAGTVQVSWDGLEVRLMGLLATRLNFTFEIVEPRQRDKRGPTYGVIEDVRLRRADFGLAGAYVTAERLQLVEMSAQHSKDCAAFITITSKALSPWRAVMGPFQWTVWLAIIATYLLAIFPLAFSDRLTLRHLLGNWSELENMFWYMFGTFTNSLTFGGQYSWSSTKKSSTRLLIGFYWVFTIIITACYTSSIIAFVTLPVFPETMDTIRGLLDNYYRFGTLNNDGWQSWFLNSTHADTQRLIRKLELVSDVHEGLDNVTKPFIWPYAFLGSRAQLEYLVEGNFTQQHLSRSTVFHIGDECLNIFGVALMMPKQSVYTERINGALDQLQQNGLIGKLWRELQTDLLSEKRRRSGSRTTLLRAPTAKQLSAGDAEERGLTVADTQGMFMLMGVGYGLAVLMLVSELMGGICNRLRNIWRKKRDEDRDDAVKRLAQHTGEILPSIALTLGETEKGEDGQGKTFLRRRLTLEKLVGRRGSAQNMVRRQTGQRNNSLATMFEFDGKTVGRGPEVRFVDADGREHDGGDGEYVGPIINRVPTPYDGFEERFGEKVVH